VGRVDYEHETEEIRDNQDVKPSRPGLSNAAPAGAMAPAIYFPGAPRYSAGFNINQNLKKKIFLNKSMFKFVFMALP
jgi:hypothetical protein